MRRWAIRIAVSGVLLFAVIGLSGGWWALEQTQQVPEFYISYDGTGVPMRKEETADG